MCSENDVETYLNTGYFVTVSVAVWKSLYCNMYNRKHVRNMLTVHMKNLPYDIFRKGEVVQVVENIIIR